MHAIVTGVGISFFWSAATVIYLFGETRRSTESHLTGSLPTTTLVPFAIRLPVVGIPATDSQIESNGKVHSGKTDREFNEVRRPISD